MNVYEAAQKRIEFIFNEFDNIYVSFSGGKDSGVLLNLCIYHIKKNNLKKRIGVLVIDLEAQYNMTIQYVSSQIEEIKDYVDTYWVALPINLRNSVSNYQPYWICWDKDKKDAWVRPMPKDCINEDNHNFDFYKHGMEFEEFTPKFGTWYAKKGKTACLVGIRTQESLNRWRTINSKTKTKYKKKKYSTKIDNEIYNFYPIYDWRTEDIWIANYRNGWMYNKLYDYMHYAGLGIHAMRICQPYGDDQRIGLNLYRAIEPETWEKLINRVNGANFGNIYCGTKAIGFNKVTKPDYYSWKEYTKFLLNSLPENVKKEYKKKFKTFMKHWLKFGSPIPHQLKKSIPANSYITEYLSTRGKKDKNLIKYKTIPDMLDGDFEKNKLAPSWRRMAHCIIKNDLLCKGLSFGQTKKQIEFRNEIIKKYKAL